MIAMDCPSMSSESLVTEESRPIGLGLRYGITYLGSLWHAYVYMDLTCIYLYICCICMYTYLSVSGVMTRRPELPRYS